MIIMDKDRLWEYTTNAIFVAISDEVRVIGERAFAHGRMPVEFVVIPPSVTEIEDYAFFDCNEMSSILIPGSVTKIGKKAFGYGIDGKIPSFAIYGEAGSAAERYAAENDFYFLLQHENAPSFDDFTLGYYKSDKVKLDLFADNEIDDDFTIPAIHEEAAQFIRKALEFYQTNYGEAVKYLKDAWLIYMEMHLTEAQIAGLEPEPSMPEEQKAALYRLIDIWIGICFHHSAAAALKDKWQEVYSDMKEAGTYYWLSCDRNSEKEYQNRRRICKTLGVSSLMLGNAAEALYWFFEEKVVTLDIIWKYHKKEEMYGVVAEYFERISDGMLMYGYLTAAEEYCRMSASCRKSLIQKACEEGNVKKSDELYNAGSRFMANDIFREALIKKDLFQMMKARDMLKRHRDMTARLSEKQKEEITADIRRMKEITDEEYEWQFMD